MKFFYELPVEVEDKTIKIPIKFGYIALKRFQEESGEALSNIIQSFYTISGDEQDKLKFFSLLFSKIPMKELETLVWYAIEVGYEYKKQKPEIKRDQLQWIIEDNIGSVAELFKSQIPDPKEQAKEIKKN